MARYKVYRWTVTKSYYMIVQGESSMCTGQWKTLKMASYFSRWSARVCDVAMAVEMAA